MRRNLFYRDFTLCKAALLAGLIGVAAWVGDVPMQERATAAGAEDTPRVVFVRFGTECDKEWSGITL